MNQTIVDSHIHFWDPGFMTYPWLKEFPDIDRPFLPEDLQQAAARFDLRKIVFVQADCIDDQGLTEVEFVTTLAEDEPRIRGIVAFAPLELGYGTRSWLEKLAANPLVKGVRRLIQYEDLDFCTQPKFIAAVRMLSEFDLSFDICIFHRHLASVIELVRKCPETAFVLDHLGKPGVRDGLTGPWHDEIAQLARLPNVLCKLSGLATEADHRNWTREQLEPYMRRVIGVFGPERLMYGADWPVSVLAISYGEWVDMVDNVCSGFSAEDKHKLFYENADRFYRLA